MRLFDRLTILVIPRAGAKIISLRVPPGALPALLGLLLAGLVGLGTSAFLYAGRVERDATIGALREERDSLTREMALIRDSVDRLSNDLARIAELETEVRLASDMPLVDPAAARAGVGGRTLGMLEDAAIDPAFDPSFGGEPLRSQVDGLLRRARFQRASLTQVAQVLALRREGLARMPSISPVPNGRVTSPFGKRMDPFTGEEGIHEGLDISAPAGAAIVATADGTVVATDSRTGYGMTVEIDHQNGLRTIYSHVSKIYVQPGDRVSRGDVVAAVGSSGRATSPHCHYEVHEDGVATDPSEFVLSGGIVFD